MTVPSIVAIAGSLSRPSRTRQLVEEVAGRIQARVNATLSLIDLGELAPDLGRCLSRSAASEPLEAALRKAETADLIVAGSPIYKGSYTGFFKHFVDLLDYRSLAGAPIALLATGGSDRHALAVEHQMRPLFGSFDALTLPTAVFVAERDLVDGRVVDDRLQSRVDALVHEAVGVLARVGIAA